MDDDITRIDELILNGAMEVDGITESGSFLYKFTDKLKDIDPELYKNIIQVMYKEVLFLWETGFISMDITSNDPVINLTQKAFDKNSTDLLPESTKINLFSIIKSIQEQS
jgi:hypothetical protein